MKLSHINCCALVVEGGAMRSVFSAGVLDGFLSQQFNPFDLYLGVSAGAYNLLSYLAGKSGVGLRVYLELATSKQFINYRRFLGGGHLIDLDWLVQATLHDTTLNPRSLYCTSKPLIISATDIYTGQAVYIEANHENIENAIKASMALPVVYRNFPLIEGRAMTDGGVADGIPVAEAIRRGATHILVIRSRPIDYIKRDSVWHKFIRWKLQDFPALVQTLRERVSRFDEAITLIRHPPPGIHILEVCPPATFNSGRFNRHKEQLRAGYAVGFAEAELIMQRWLTLFCK
jgi:predicted patatin/cPLA2 family phospholipase